MEQRLCVLQSKTVRERAYVAPITGHSRRLGGKFAFKMGLVLVLVVALVGAVCGEEPPGRAAEPRRIDSGNNGLENTDLVLAFVIFRHGDRTPDNEELDLFPSEEHLSDSLFFPYGKKALTNKGKQRSYFVGKYLRELYDGFISRLYLPDEITIRTTDYSRTQMTALAALSALYPPPPAQKWNPNLDWQPIPYNTPPFDDDDLLYWYNCPRYLWLRDKTYERPEVKKWIEPYQSLFRYISEKTMTNITKPEDVFFLDNLFQTLNNVGVRTPKWAQEIMPQIKALTKIEYAIEFYNAELIQLASGVLMQSIVNTTSSVVHNTTYPIEPRLYLYSAHENNVAALMARAHGSRRRVRLLKTNSTCRTSEMEDERRNSRAEGAEPTAADGRKGSQFDNRKGSVFEKTIDLDHVLVHELGQFGRYQMVNLLLVSIPIIMSAFMSEYIFSAAAIPHRCQITECQETSKTVADFNPDWLSGAIPPGNNVNGYDSCSRYQPVGGNGTLDYCPAQLFNTNVQQDCDAFVYARDNSCVYDFDLGCQDWLRALAGTLSSVGTLLVLPFAGYVSDNFGRRVALVISVTNLALFGVIRAFSVNYPMYLTLQLLQTTFGAGTFSSSYIFATEFVGPKYRVLTSATCSSMFAVGQVILGSVAWLIEPWRYMILAIHIPCFLIITYYWVLSESVRWLLSKKKYDKARKVLERVAKRNGTQISEKSMHALMNPPEPVKIVDDADEPGLIKAIFRSGVLLRRVCTTPIWWITTTFVYYGLSINATSLSDTMHLNYILTCAIEIPGFYTAVLILDRIGRKATLSGGYLFSAACNIAFAFIPDDLATLRLVVYLLGKFGISVVFTSLYLFTSELYPTQYRHQLLAFSSMIGRIGSITAPLTPVLMDYWPGLPSVMFGGMGILSGILVLTQPETLGTKMPDTLAEAEALGKPESKIQK